MTAETFLDGRVTLHIGDVRDKLRAMPSDHFDCVVTSPPYWGLRDYGVDGQLGMEGSLGEHVSVMVDVFREVKRVLKPTGTLWLNYGDSYAASPNGRSAADIKLLGTDDRTYRDKPFSTIGPISRVGQNGNKGNAAADHGNRIVTGGKLAKWDRKSERNGHNFGADDSTVADVRIMPGGFLKPKDLCGIPWRVAFGLQDDGWWLRQDIIWSKPNPMPESVTDRCTKAHEYIFLMSKAQYYFYDAQAIAEALAPSSLVRLDQDVEALRGSDRVPGKTNGAMKAVRSGKAATSPRNDGNPWNENNGRGFLPTSNTRNKRSVWEIATQPFSEAHFATFPLALIEPCILAGCPIGGKVLDPFGGSGTTALVAAQLGCTATLIELNPEYAVLARARIEAAFMGKEEGSRHMVKKIGKLDLDPGPLFSLGLDSQAS